MDTKTESTTGSSKQDVVIKRVLDAPRDLVFKAWTEPERLMCWWGPNTFTTPVVKVDLRRGGVFHYDMRSPEGRDFWGKGVYREIVKSERIVYSDSFADAEGNTVPATYYGMSADWPDETLVTVTFAGQDGKTELTLQLSGAPAGTDRDMAVAGWGESLDRLGEYLAKA